MQTVTSSAGDGLRIADTLLGALDGTRGCLGTRDALHSGGSPDAVSRQMQPLAILIGCWAGQYSQSAVSLNTFLILHIQDQL